MYKYDTSTKKTEFYFPGDYKLFQEPVFIPRNADASEGDGWLLALLNNYEDMTSELTIVDTNDMSKHVALIKLPLRLRMGIHGNWVDDADVDGHPAEIVSP